MKPIFKKTIICFLAALCCSALLLNREGYAGVQVISGVSVLSENPLLTLFFRKLEILGGFKNPFIGPWLGILSVIIDLIVFILLFRPAKD